jgi:4F5 protein related disordered region
LLNNILFATFIATGCSLLLDSDFFSGNKRDVDRARAMKRNEGKGGSTKDDGLTPLQRKERCLAPACFRFSVTRGFLQTLRATATLSANRFYAPRFWFEARKWTTWLTEPDPGLHRDAKALAEKAAKKAEAKKAEGGAQN